MSILPIRKLGQLGVITDVSAFDLAPNAWTMGVNVRFEDDSIHRSPIFRIGGPLTNSNPQSVVSYSEASGIPVFIVLNSDGTAQQWATGGPGNPSTLTSMTAAGWTPSTFSEPYTSCLLDDIVYINRPDREPWYVANGGDQFAPLTNWPTGWLCRSLREFNGQLIAINVTQGATAYPTMVAWSDVTTFGSIPDSWTATAENLAGNNVLQDLGDALIDGAPMYSFFVLYSQNETWVMTPTGNNSEVFSFSRLYASPPGTPFQRGIINQNCIVTHDNIHFLFGPTDIWMNDGYSAQSLAAGRVRNFIYNNMVKSQSNLFFCIHQPRLDEIMFCYVSNDEYTNFPVGGNIGYPGCNRAAVYNYRCNTWYFYDLPYITGAGIAPPTQNTTWSALSSTSWTNFGGAWQSYSDDSLLALMTVNPAVSAQGVSAMVESFELPDSPNASGSNDPSATSPVYLEKQSIDLDEVGADLRGYKVVKSIYPEGTFSVGASPLSFQFAGADYSNQSFTYGNPMTFDGASDYKLDYQTPGRYLSMLVTTNDYHDFTLSALDMDVTITGSR